VLGGRHVATRMRLMRVRREAFPVMMLNGQRSVSISYRILSESRLFMEFTLDHVTSSVISVSKCCWISLLINVNIFCLCL
jgi:hypothetical protein